MQQGLTPPVMLGGLEPPPPVKGPCPVDTGFFHFLPQHHPTSGEAFDKPGGVPYVSRRWVVRGPGTEAQSV